MSKGAAGSQRRILFCEETTEGAIPGTPAWFEVPSTGGSGLKVGRSSIKSGVIRSDMQTLLPTAGNKSVGFNLPVELSYGQWDKIFESLLRGAITTGVLANGTTRKSFTVEEGFLDIAQFLVAHGMIANALSLSLRPNGKVSGSFDFIGLTADAPAAASLASTFTEALDADTFDTINGAFLEGGSAFECPQELSLSINGGGAHKHALFNDNPNYNALGAISISGTLTTYFKDAAIMTKFLAGTASSLAFEMEDPAGNKVKIELLAIRYVGDAGHSVSETDIPLSFPFEAGVDPVSGKMIKITFTAHS